LNFGLNTDVYLYDLKMCDTDYRYVIDSIIILSLSHILSWVSGHLANGHLANGHLANGHLANRNLANICIFKIFILHLHVYCYILSLCMLC